MRHKIATPTTRRVWNHTQLECNEDIKNLTIQNISKAVESYDEVELNECLRQLDHEWDIERILETNASFFMLISLGLGLLKSRKLLVLPVIIAVFLLQHSIQGWCPPLVLLRRLKRRTQTEIDQEKFALKFHRGDFKDVKRSFRYAESLYEACAY